MDVVFWHSVFSITAIVCTILGAFCAVGTHMTGKILDKLSEEGMKSLQNTVSDLKPRFSSVDEEKLNIFLSELKKLDKSLKFAFVSKFQDGEAYDFTLKLYNLFKKAGLTVADFIDQTYLGTARGCFIHVEDTKAFKESILLISNFFSEVGFECKQGMIEVNSTSGVLDQNTIYIVVGRK